MTVADLALAKERLAAAEALPEGSTARAAIIGHWRAEVRILLVQIAADRADEIMRRRFLRAQRRVEAGG